MSDKQVNYSEELTAIVVEKYNAAVDSDEGRKAALEAISAETGKTVKSLRAKLVREGVYVKNTYTPKTGGKAETKNQIVSAIARTLGVAETELSGLDKATKSALELIRSEFNAAREAASDSE